MSVGGGGGRADVEAREIRGEGKCRGGGGGVAVFGRGEDVVGGEEEGAVGAFGFAHEAGGEGDAVAFDEAATDTGGDFGVEGCGVLFEEGGAGFAGVGVDLGAEDVGGGQEGVGHRAADAEGVAEAEEGFDDGDFVGDFCAAEDGDEGVGGVKDGLAEVFDFLHDEESGGFFFAEVGDHDAHRGVGAVAGAEGVVDVDIGERGELGGEGFVTFFFAGVEAEVFEEEDLAVLELLGLEADAVANAVIRKDNVAFGEERGEPHSATGAREYWGSGFLLGRPKWEARIGRPPFRMIY